MLLVSSTSKGTVSSSTRAYRASVFTQREPSPAGFRLLSITECSDQLLFWSQFIFSPPQTLDYCSASCSSPQFIHRISNKSTDGFLVNTPTEGMEGCLTHLLANLAFHQLSINVKYSISNKTCNLT